MHALRDDLRLHATAPAADGSPRWVIHDPARHRFYQIDWPAFEILSRWHEADPATLAARVAAETPLRVGPDDVDDLHRFLAEQQLLRPAPGGGLELWRRARAGRLGPGQWLLHHYLFFRIPLLRPDRFLAATLPALAWIYHRRTLGLLAVAAVVAAVLLLRQLDPFRASLVDLLSPAGLVRFAGALALAKLAHEFGHAYTAKYYGCRVPTMGVAFLVLWPMLYTDVSAVWTLRHRRQRFAVSLAGLAAELGLAVLAALAWSLLPPGAARELAFVLATTSLASSLLLNLSPFMRFDGYFLLSDWLDLPNLHERAFALARWQLREWLFALGAPPPETFAPRRRRFLILFAFATWIYRLLLFLGIALLVYHFFIKLVGIFLFLVEIGWFVLRPIWREVGAWRRLDLRLGVAGRWRRPAVPLLLTVLLLLLPWQTAVQAPALWAAGRHVTLYAPGPGRLARIAVGEGEAVAAGAPLFVLDHPELGYRRERAGRQAEIVAGEREQGRFAAALRERARVLTAEDAAVAAADTAAARQQQRLELRAPFAGTAIDLEPDLAPGTWLGKGQRLGALRDTGPARIVAYVGEDDIDRIAPGAACRFYPEALDRPVLACRVAAIDPAAVRALQEPLLANLFGGPLPVRAQGRQLIPERALYRLRIDLDDPAAGPGSQMRGTVAIDGRAASLLGRLLQTAGAVALRESGF